MGTSQRPGNDFDLVAASTANRVTVVIKAVVQ